MMDDKKNPHPWRAWILTALIVSQILTAIQIRQANQKLWKIVIQRGEDVIQLGDRLSDHLEYEIHHNEEMNQLVEEENRLLEEWYQNLEEFLSQNPVDCK